MTRTELLVLTGLIAIGLYLRSMDLADRPLEVDEAESTINALTILEHGYPTSEYMGMPIYENTLSEPWPESAEYEFRDNSYSEQGVAVYHAWLPLYAIAAALKLAGIEPDPPTAALKPRHSTSELGFRRLVPRLPSLFFSAILMLTVFAFGRTVMGPACGWTALVLAAITRVTVQLGSPARYYSATLAMAALAGFTLWRLLEHGRRRDGLAHGLTMTLLFHCHVITCLVLGLVSLGALPVLLRRPGFWRWALPCGCVFLLGTVPWILFTGFPGSAGEIPKAWTAMDLPGDLIWMSGQSILQVAGLSLASLWVLLSLTIPRALPDALSAPARAHRRAFILSIGWGLIAFFVFSFRIPLISYFASRMSMMLAVPKLLFVACLITATSRAWLKWRGTWIAPAAAFSLLLVTGRLADFNKTPRDGPDGITLIANYLEAQSFEPDARLYTEPNQQLILAYALGLPVQSIAPVRKSFLDAYPGEIIYITFPGFRLNWDAERVLTLLAATQAQGQWHAELPSAEEAARIADAARSLTVREGVRAAGAEILGPELPALPAPVAAALADERAGPQTGWWTNVPTFSGFGVQDPTFAWKVFFYRFVDPVTRSGAGANYADRLKGSTAEVLSSASSVIYRAPLAKGSEGDR